jgi:hypothetical protein
VVKDDAEAETARVVVSGEDGDDEEGAPGVDTDVADQPEDAEDRAPDEDPRTPDRS